MLNLQLAHLGEWTKRWECFNWNCSHWIDFALKISKLLSRKWKIFLVMMRLLLKLWCCKWWRIWWMTFVSIFGVINDVSPFHGNYSLNGKKIIKNKFNIYWLNIPSMKAEISIRVHHEIIKEVQKLHAWDTMQTGCGVVRIINLLNCVHNEIKWMKLNIRNFHH